VEAERKLEGKKCAGLLMLDSGLPIPVFAGTGAAENDNEQAVVDKVSRGLVW